MQSCSVHHCVLFLLTLTFTTDPGSAAEFPIYAKLHQPVTLPCGAQCSGWAKWSLDNNRDVVFAQCDQTSCTSEKDGFKMSYDQYLRGDLSLTITNPDYSMRNNYTCECDYSDYATARLRISTVSSAVHVQTEGDLKLDLSVPESVEVIYRGSDSADGVQICTVTDRTLQCNTEYTPRTSLSNSELTLRDVQRSESGTYTIRNLDYKEDIRVYAVSVSGLTSGETAGIVIPVLLLVLLIGGVVYYMWRKAEQKRRQVKSDMVEVYDLINETLDGAAVEEAELQQVEEKIKDLELKYRDDREYSEAVRMFCDSKRSYLKLYRDVFTPKNRSVTEEVKTVMNEVDDLIKKAELSPGGEKREVMWEALLKITDLELKYSRTAEYYMDLAQFCSIKRTELKYCSVFYGTQNETTEPQRKEMDAVDDLIKKVLHPPPGEQEEKVLQDAEKKINDLIQKHPDLRVYWLNKRDELNLCRKIYATQKGSLQPETEEVMDRMEAVYNIIRENKHSPAGELEEKIKELEQKYTGDRDYCSRVELFWNLKRRDLELCSKLGLLKLEFIRPNTKKEMEKVEKMLNELKWRSDQTDTPDLLPLMYTRASSSLKGINEWCRERRDNLPKFKQQLSDEQRDDKMIHDVERHLKDLDLWCRVKECELEIYSRKLKQRGGEISDTDPQTSRSKEGEDTALLQVKTEQM